MNEFMINLLNSVSILSIYAVIVIGVLGLLALFLYLFWTLFDFVYRVQLGHYYVIQYLRHRKQFHKWYDEKGYIVRPSINKDK